MAIPTTDVVPIPVIIPKSPSYLISDKVSSFWASDSIRTCGGLVFVYPRPAATTDTEDTLPTPEIDPVAVALVDSVVPIPACTVPIPAVTPIETTGLKVNPDPPLEITILEIVPRPDTTAVAAAPVLVVLSTINGLL